MLNGVYFRDVLLYFQLIFFTLLSIDFFRLSGVSNQQASIFLMITITRRTHCFPQHVQLHYQLSATEEHINIAIDITLHLQSIIVFIKNKRTL